MPEGDEGKEAERLIVLLETPGIRDSDPDKVTEAIRRLGRIGDERAIPILAEYLDFKRPATDYEKVGGRSTETRYTARKVLIEEIGKAATGEVIGYIRKHGIESVGGDNAFGCCTITAETQLTSFLAYFNFSTKKPPPHRRRGRSPAGSHRSISGVDGEVRGVKARQ